MGSFYENVFRWAEGQAGEAEELLIALGRIPAPTREEDRRAEFVRKWFQDAGFEDVFIDSAKNVICPYQTEKNREIVVFAAHTDIVFPDTEELPMRQEGRTLYAPGIGDDTANLVNLMICAKYISRYHPAMKKGILFIANACEEGMGNLDGTKAVFEAYGDRITEFYSFDGYLSQCTSDAVGSHRYRVSVKETGGHSYLDFGRENAIAVISRMICDLYSQQLPDNPVKTTFNVGRIYGGSTVNSIAEEAEMLYEYRSPSNANLLFMMEQFNGIMNRYREKHKLDIELMGVRPGKGSFGEGVLEAWTERNIGIINEFYKGPLDLKAYSTDSNIPLSKGITANTIGTIAGGMAHTREEWVDLDSIPQGLAIVLSIMLTYSAEESPGL